ncbi:MAG: CPBP family glutamic-type intramembrane protease, partial [Planctomycetaceae bacterium]
MKGKSAAPVSDEYWQQARRPLASLAFLVPLLLVYEIGVLRLSGGEPAALRNGADFWMRAALERIGLGSAAALPALVVLGLLAWQWCGKHRWRVSPHTLGGMLAESLLFAFVLVVMGQLQDLAFPRSAGVLSLDGGAAARAITFVGAGVYEEFLFRLCLLPACLGLFRLSQLSPRWSAVLSVLATSLAFSLAHYAGPAGESFSLFTFSFRALAGAFFGALFLARGFGITVGC